MARTATARKVVQTKKKPVKRILIKPSGMSPEKLKRYSDALLRTIRRELGNAIFFTREDLIHLSLLSQVGTMTRYQQVCEMIRYLERRGDVIIRSRTNIILSGDHEKAYDDKRPLHQQHYETIQTLVGNMPPRTSTTVMDIVALWTTDPHLTINNKRVAVRGALTHLVKDGLLRRVDDFQFMVQRR